MAPTSVVPTDFPQVVRLFSAGFLWLASGAGVVVFLGMRRVARWFVEVAGSRESIESVERFDAWVETVDLLAVAADRDAE